MMRTTSVLHAQYVLYHRRSLGTLKFSKWAGMWGGVSKFYNRTCMVEEVKNNEPITLIDRKMMAYVHQTRLRHFQLGRSYQEKYRSTEVKLSEGSYLRRKWHRKLQKAFIAYMQFKVKDLLEEQAKLVNEFGQAAVNRALGDPANDTEQQRSKRLDAIRRKVRTLPSVPSSPKHIATMKQIHNDRFDYRWRMN